MGGERRKLPKLKRRKLAQLKAKLPQVEIGGCKVHRINFKNISGTLGLGGGSTPEPDANNVSGVDTPQSDLAAFKQSLIKICRVTERPEPHIPCCPVDGLYVATVLVGTSGRFSCSFDLVW